MTKEKGKGETTVALNGLDAAIILREDGAIEASLPDLGNPEDIPENLVFATALMAAIQNDELYDAIIRNFEVECAKMDTEIGKEKTIC
ncbi:MAG: hypothetical protein HON43_07410 [Alphaproteobacteria bacterium]|jgi:hypothetical protein|nr:hypothetical protein [Alphaproteobacteria bacterium]MBT5390368.1 hypothetical protein [Alphaproteobacteria bacterium]MBT5540233.1 hypothetical protein [Alphaproteobacteria bacterium]